MADTKISALTAGAPALSTDELPIARSGNNFKLTVDDFATYISGANVLSQTVAQAQANNGTVAYTSGTYILITDNIGGLGGSSSTLFQVGDGGVIQPKGYCRTYLSGAMDTATPVYITWDCTSDFVSEIEEPVRGNRVTAFYSTAGLTGFPFDTTSILQTTIIDPNVCSIDVDAIIKLSNFFGYNSITIGAGCTFYGNAGQEATVSLSGTSQFFGTLGVNAGVTLFGTQALIGGTYIGDGKNVDCSLIDSAYTQTGGYYAGNVSTFTITSADSAAVNPDVTNVIDMSTFPFAGILNVDDFTNNLNQITNFPLGHKFRIITNGHLIVDFVNSSGTGVNIRANTLYISSSPYTTSIGDYIELEVAPFSLVYLNSTIFQI